jgi:signal transduction histidine kinase
MPSVFTRLREAVTPWPARARVPADVEEAFEAQCDARLDHQGKILEAALLLVNVVWWPFDWIVFAPDTWRASALIPARLFHITVASIYLLLPRPPAVKRVIFWILAAVACAEAAVGSDAAASLGGPESPYFHTIHMTVLMTIFLPLSFRRRAALTAALAIAVLAGVEVHHHEYLTSPASPYVVSFLILSFLLSMWIGHSHFALGRENFGQARELEGHARLLESRVAERTEELRALLDRIETDRETERGRIARELHDELGQELSALRYSLGLTRLRYGKEPTSIAANLSDLEDLLGRTARTTRDLVTDLRPRVLDDLGLGAAVEWLVRRAEQRSDLRCRLATRGELSALDDRVATTAFRVLQEALTNAVRHARANEIEVDVAVKDGHVELRVQDDGIGIDAGRARRDETSSGVGLLGMRERVLALGGTVSVRDLRPQAGTVIQCRLPLHPSSGRSDARRPPRWDGPTSSAGAVS